jgi:cytochrome b-561
MMAYRSVAATHDVQKIFHMFLNLLAICLGIIGICAVFKFHDMIKTVDVYSLHSWIGIATITLYCLQVTKKNQVYQLIIRHIFFQTLIF